MVQTHPASAQSDLANGAAPSLDGHFHGLLTKASMGLAPISLALRDIRAPMRVVGTVRDRVSPWRSVYKIHLHAQTQSTSILVAGGHNAGIVSETGHPRRSCRMRLVPKGRGWIEPDDWLTQAPLSEGSWWPAMHAWLKEQLGIPVPAKAIDADRVLGDALGDYVMVRYAD